MTVRSEMVIDDLSGRGRHTVLSVAWDSSDPLAVVLTLTCQPDHPSLPRGEWVVLRDFLRYGLTENTGDGEVRICPVDGVVRLSLARDVRPASVSVPAEWLSNFLDRTDALMPLDSSAAVDDLLDRLLRKA